MLEPLVLSALLGFIGVGVYLGQSPSSILWEDRHLMIYGSGIICQVSFCSKQYGGEVSARKSILFKLKIDTLDYYGENVCL